MTDRKQRGFLAQLWFGFWGSINWLRRVVLNVVFLLLVFYVLKLAYEVNSVEPIKSNTTLVLQPQGVVVEQYSSSPFQLTLSNLSGSAEPETRLRDLLQALKLAKNDSQISQVLIDVRQLSAIGLSSLQELQVAITDFKTSGKTIYALGGFMEQSQYYLASLADEVWIEPDGLVWLDGYASYRNYYKDGLDKLAVDINLFRVGEYKSAAEPYIRNDMSPQDREARLFLLDGLWQQYLEVVAQNRGLPLDALERNVNGYANSIEAHQGNATQVAVDIGLVDAIKSRPQMRAELAQTGSSNGNNSFRQIGFHDYLSRQPDTGSSNKIGIVVAEGEIVGGTGGPGMAGSSRISSLLRKAANDDDIKAVVFRINSPGGGAFASEVIRQEVINLRESGKPVLVSMGDVAASGGYWIAMGADEVWSNAGTITGSIGIFGLLPTFQDSLAKLGVYTDGVGTTSLSGGFRGDRELSAGTRQIMQALIENGYTDFLSLVAEHRQMEINEVDRIAQGRVWTGQQALARDLIDQQGGLYDVIAATAKRADMGQSYEVEWLEESLSPWQEIVSNWSAQLLISLDVDISELLPSAKWQLPTKLESRLQTQLAPLLRQYDRPGVLAHCLCLPN